MVLGNHSIENIEAEAAQLLSDAFGDSDNPMLPVDVDGLTLFLGVTLKRVRFENRAIAGTFKPSPPTILVDDTDIPERQCFTVAHELGHFYLGHGSKMDGRTEVLYRQAVETEEPDVERMEQEADWFAASLLMPRAAVNILYPLFKDDLAAMAQAFGVSRPALSYRLKNLNLVG